MSTYETTPAVAGVPTPTPATTASRDRTRHRAIAVTTIIAATSLGLVVDLLLVGHTSGEEIWGPVTAAFSFVVATLSLGYISARGRNRAARLALYALWATVAFFGYGGYNDHRLPVPAGTVDERTRPPLAPLAFTGLGIVGAFTLRSASKEE